MTRTPRPSSNPLLALIAADHTVTPVHRVILFETRIRRWEIWSNPLPIQREVQNPIHPLPSGQMQIVPFVKGKSPTAFPLKEKIPGDRATLLWCSKHQSTYRIKLIMLSHCTGDPQYYSPEASCLSLLSVFQGTIHILWPEWWTTPDAFAYIAFLKITLKLCTVTSYDAFNNCSLTPPFDLVWSTIDYFVCLM